MWPPAAWARRSLTRKTRAGAGRRALGRRAHQLLAQRLRPAAPLHRTTTLLRRGLPRPGRRHRHPPRSPPSRLVPLPLEHPPKITAHPMTYWRRPIVGPVAPAGRRRAGSGFRVRVTGMAKGPSTDAGALRGVVRRRPTLPPRLQGSTIGAERLSFRVRNVAGRFPLAMAAVTL